MNTIHKIFIRVISDTGKKTSKIIWLQGSASLKVWPVTGTYRYPHFFSLVPGTQRYPISEIFSVPGNQRYPRFLNFDGYRPLMPTPTYNTKKHENSKLKKFLKKISVSKLLTRFFTQEKTQNYYTKKILTLKKISSQLIDISLTKNPCIFLITKEDKLQSCSK